MVEVLPQLLSKVPALTILLRRDSLVLQAQQAMLVSCTYFHQLEPRLARWLLKMVDRVQLDDLVITHDFLAGHWGEAQYEDSRGGSSE